MDPSSCPGTPCNSSRSSLVLEKSFRGSEIKGTSTPLMSPALKYLRKIKGQKEDCDLSAITEEPDTETESSHSLKPPKESASNMPALLSGGKMEHSIHQPMALEGAVDNLNDAEEPSVKAEEVVYGCCNLNATVIYCDMKEEEADEEILQETKLDDLSLLLEKPTNDVITGPIKLLEPIKEEEEEVKDEVQVKGLQVFESKNENENADNNNPEWQRLKELKTDEERFDAIQSRWMNVAHPDPKRNLSSFSWRKKNNLGPLKRQKQHAARCFNLLRNWEGASCTTLFEKCKNDAREVFEQKLNFAEETFRDKLDMLAEKQTREIYYTRGQDMDYLNYKHEKELDDLLVSKEHYIYQLRLAYNERVHCLNRAIDETERVYKYCGRLNGQRDALKLEGKELQQWFEVEEMAVKYFDYYSN